MAGIDGPPFAVGFGYDVHQFAPHRRLVLGGVFISEEDGLLGHSDADVLLHALCDSILGAAGLPDIGHLFPNTDDTWKDADSKILLREVHLRIEGLNWTIGNVDMTVVAERPRIAPFVPQMKEIISRILTIPESRVAIKATTNETMGFVGRGEGIAAMATTLLYRQAI